MNKITHGLSNAYYALISYETDETTGVVTTKYGTPKAWPGAVSVALSPEGSVDPVYADNGVHFNKNNNKGYSGDFESEVIPEDVKTSIFGQHKDTTTGMVYETGDDKVGEFAFMFQFEGDETATRHIFYRCTATRTAVEGETDGDSINEKTAKVTITAMKRKDADHMTKGYMEKDAAEYDNFFKSVIVPTVAPATKPEG